MWEKGTCQEIEKDMELDWNHTQRDNVFNGSELAYTCMFKAYQDRKLGKEFNANGKYAIYRGRIFDQYLTKLFDENEVRVSQRVPKTPYTIRGRIDGVNYERNEIYEVKSVASIKYVRDEPYQHHIPQGMFYLNNYDPMATLKFLYVSMDGYRVLTYKQDPTEMRTYYDSYNEKAKILGNALRKEEPPEPIKCNECKWCNYKGTVCPIGRRKKK